MLSLKKYKESNSYTHKIITLFSIFSILATFLVFLFSYQITKIIAPGFNEITTSETNILLKIYSPYLFFVTISSVIAAILQSNDNFFGSQIREFISYVPIIVFGPFLYSLYGVYGFCISLLLGGISRLFIQFPFSKKIYKYRLDFDFKDVNVINLLKKIPPVLLASASTQIHAMVDKIMASFLFVGAVSGLNYGSKLTNVINGLFASTISTIIYPEMQTYIVNKEEKKLNTLMERILIMIGVIIIPITIIGIMFSKFLVQIVYMRGGFDAKSVILTSSVFSGYLIGLYFTGIKDIIDKLFYSLEKNKIIMFFNFMNVVLNIILNFILVNFLGLAGLAYATSASSILYVAYTMFFLKKAIGFNFYSYFKKIAFITLVNLMSYSFSYFTFYTLSVNGASLMLASATSGTLITLLIYHVTGFSYHKHILKIIKLR